MVQIGKTDKKFREDIRDTTFKVMKDVTNSRKGVINKVSSKKIFRDMGIDIV